MNKLGKIIAVAVTFAVVVGLTSFATAHHRRSPAPEIYYRYEQVGFGPNYGGTEVECDSRDDAVISGGYTRNIREKGTRILSSAPHPMHPLNDEGGERPGYAVSWRIDRPAPNLVIAVCVRNMKWTVEGF